MDKKWKNPLSEKCPECEHIDCVGFFRKKDGERIEGGELYLLWTLIEKRIHNPCEGGGVIHSLCQTLVNLEGTLSFELYLTCIKDLRTVYFLIITGHYRTAMQVMRPIIENWLIGLFWDAKVVEAENEEEFNEVVRDQARFRTGEDHRPSPGDTGFTSGRGVQVQDLNHDFLLGWLSDKGIFYNANFIEGLFIEIRELHNCLHPVLKRTEMGRSHLSGCSSCVTYNEEEHKRCVKLFQDVCVFMLDTIYAHLIADPTDMVQIQNFYASMDQILRMPLIEKETGVQLVFSIGLDLFIRRINEEMGELEVKGNGPEGYPAE